MNDVKTTIADEHLSGLPGLIWAYQFPAGGGPGTEIRELSSLNTCLSGEGFVWLHFALPDVRFEQQIKDVAEIPEEAADILVGRDRHLFLSARPLVLAGVMPDFRRELDDQLKDIDRFRFALTDKWLITTRTNPLNSTARLRADVAAGMVFGSTIELFSALSDAFERTIEMFVDRLTESIDTIEEEIYRGRHGTARGRIGNIRMDIAQVHRTLRTLTRLYQRLDSSDNTGIADDVRSAIERRAQHTAALDQDVLHLQERARLLQDEVSSRQQDEMNRSLLVLSVVTILFMPPTLITGFFGMNTKDLFLQSIDNGTAYAAAIIVAAAGAAWWLLRRYNLDRHSD